MADAEPDLQLEIGHVLLIDIVGYSKLLSTGSASDCKRSTKLYGTPRNSERQGLPASIFETSSRELG